MSFRVYVNGVRVPDKEVSGEDGVNLSMSADQSSTGAQTKRVSGELTFYGDTYEVLKAALIEPQDGRLQKVPARITEDCCTPERVLLEGFIKGDTVGWCEGACSLTCFIVEETEESEAVACLKNTLIFDNWNGFQEQNHPKLPYCDEVRPHWLHHTILILGIILMLVLTVLVPIVAIMSLLISVVNAVIDAVNTIPGVDIEHIDFDGNASTTFLDEYNALRENLATTIIGCGRVHPSPYLRSYINNACGKCGLGFSSSILNDPASDYYNTVLWNAPVKRGTNVDTDTYIYPNRPVETADTLLAKVAPVFNARRAVVDGVLHFERRDMMPDADTWIDPAVLRAQGRLVKEVCYNWSKKPLPSFLEIGFFRDGMDCVGDEANELYQDTIEWNQPYNSVQTGSEQRQFQFGMLRCRRDNEGSDILDSYLTFDGLFFLNRIDHYGSAMMLERGIAAQPKLIIVECGPNYWPAKPYDVLGYVKPFASNYNFPYHFNEHNVAPNTAYPTNEPNMGVYGRFHTIDHPKVTGVRGLEWEFEFEYNCEHLENLNLWATVPLPYGAGTITSIDRKSVV